MGTPVNLFGNLRGGQQQNPQQSFIDTLMSRFMAGLQIAQTIKAANQESDARKQQIEQNKLQMELMKHQLNGASLQEKLAPLQSQLEIAKLLQGLPGQQVGGQVAPGMPGMANVPESLGGPGGTQAGPATQGMFDVPRPPVNVDLNAAFPGAGQLQIPIQTQQQSLQQALMQQARLGQVDARSAGMKAGAEAGAKAPYEQDLERVKADAAANNLKFVQGQENARANLSSKTSLTTAKMGIDAANMQRSTERENKLTDDFQRDTKEFSVMDDAMAKIQSSAQLATGPGDIALIYGFMKLQDPNSSVREGEYATAQNSAGVPDRIRAAYNKAIDGEKLAPAVRNSFVAAAKNTYQSTQPRLKMIEGKYQDRAKKQGVDPNLFKFQSGANQQPAAPGAVAVGTRAEGPGGALVWNGTAWVPAK